MPWDPEKVRQWRAFLRQTDPERLRTHWGRSGPSGASGPSGKSTRSGPSGWVKVEVARKEAAAFEKLRAFTCACLPDTIGKVHGSAAKRAALKHFATDEYVSRLRADPFFTSHVRLEVNFDLDSGSLALYAACHRKALAVGLALTWLHRLLANSEAGLQVLLKSYPDLCAHLSRGALSTWDFRAALGAVPLGCALARQRLQQWGQYRRAQKLGGRFEMKSVAANAFLEIVARGGFLTAAKRLRKGTAVDSLVI